MKLKEFMSDLEVTENVKRRELVLGMAACFLAGTAIGMLIVKVYTGWSISLSIGSNNMANGSNNGASGTLNADAGKNGKNEKGRKKRK